MGRNRFRYYFPLRVRFAETDMQGIVFNGNYLNYTDTAVTEYFRHLSYPYQEMVKAGSTSSWPTSVATSVRQHPSTISWRFTPGSLS